MDENELHNILSNALRVAYIGEPALTRGNYGDNITTGRVLPGNGHHGNIVFVWDTDYGWMEWGPLNTKDWKPA